LEKKQQITIKRSSGRKEKFDTERMSQTVGRSGVPFLMARDVAKKVSRKIEHEVGDQQTTKKNGNQHELYY
jgi:transcriptional regulator NrdR family protein